MLVEVVGVDVLHEADVKRMLALFFPDSTAAFVRDDGKGRQVLDDGAGQAAALTVTAQLDGQGADLRASVTLQRGGGADPAAPVRPSSGTPVTCVRHVPAPADPAARRKAIRRALLFALHEALREATGRRQPWGILTGVRPVKLAHGRMRFADSAAGAIRDGGATAVCELDAAIARDLRDAYLIDERRAALLVEIARRERAAIPDLYGIGSEVSVYVGIPFCPTHCAYCTFPAYSMREKARHAETFLTVLERELVAIGSMLHAYGIPVTTVYVGGGTPTSLRAPELRRVLEAALRHLPGGGRWREFCVEAGRADTITPDRVAVMRELGVNRVSVNPQSFKPETLRAIRRGHSPTIVDKRFNLFRQAGFTNINMDLILGLPGETVADVEHSLARTLALGPDSVTLHTLSFKRSATVSRDRAVYAIPGDAEVVRMMEAADAAVRAAGLSPYYLYRQKDILANLENVGYARPGKEGLYNICIIEEAQTIVAAGGGGVSKWMGPGGRHLGRHQNPREPRAYVVQCGEWLSAKQKGLQAVCEAIADGRRARAAASCAGNPRPADLPGAANATGS